MRGDLDKAIWAEQQLRKRLSATNARLRALNREQTWTEQAQAIIRQAAVDTRQSIKVHIADLVTAAIQSILPEQKWYEFEASFLDKGGVEFSLKKGGRVRDPFGVGGGIVDIVSTGLRFAIWSLSQLRPVVLLDEPFRNLSRTLYGEQAKKKASALLKELSHELGLQLIVVTHDPDLIAEADAVFRVESDGEVSTIVEENGVS